MFHTDLKLLFDSVRFSNHKNEFRKYVTENPAFSRVRKGTYELMLQYADLREVGAFLQGAKTEGNKETVREKGEINMCQAMRELMEDSKKEGLSQGLSQGISQGIQVLIKKEKSWNMSREAILADIMQEFKISREEAEASMAEYDRRE